jgi:hypothetical protein
MGVEIPEKTGIWRRSFKACSTDVEESLLRPAAKDDWRTPRDGRGIDLMPLQHS